MSELSELLEKVRKLNEERKHQEVIGLLSDEVLEKYQSADLYTELAEAHYIINEDELSLKNAEKALSINPDNLDALYWKGFYFIQKQDYEKAESFMKKVMTLNSNYVRAYNGYGAISANLKKIDKAKEYYFKTLELDSNYKVAYRNLGTLHYDLKEYEEAIEYYKKSLELDPNYLKLYIWLGSSNYHLHKYEEAIKYYKKSLELDPEYSPAYNGLGNVYRLWGKVEKSIEFYQKAINSNNSNAYALNGMGNAYFDLKDLEKSKEFYLRAIKAQDKDPIPINNLGNVYFDLKDFKKSLEYHSKAIEINPEYAISHYLIGLDYDQMMLIEQAINSFEKYLELTEDSEDSFFVENAKSKLQKLRQIQDNSDHRSIKSLVEEIKSLLLFKGNYVTHYTSISASKFLIIEGSKFRLSEASFLNDTSEGTALFKFLDYEGLISDDEIEIYHYTQKPFIGSFVPEGKQNDLTLWRMYGKENNEDAKGCAFTIKAIDFIDKVEKELISKDKSEKSIFKNTELKFYHIAYRRLEDNFFIIPGQEDKQLKLNDKMTELRKAVNDFNGREGNSDIEHHKTNELLNQIAYLFKSGEYQYEHELRLIINEDGFKKLINSEYSPPKVYIELVSIRDTIQSITLGPKVERPEEWEAAFYYSLIKDKIEPSILISKLPFK